MAFRLIAWALAASTLVPVAVAAASAPSATVLEIGGVAITVADATLPTEGGAAVFSVSTEVTDNSPAVAWAFAAMRGDTAVRDGSAVTVENGVARRRATFAGASVTEVKLDDFDSNNSRTPSKKPVQVAFKWEAETVEFSKPSGKVAASPSKPATLWDGSTFRIDGLPGTASSLVRASLPKITISRGKGVTKIGNLVLEFEGADVDTLHAQVKKAIHDGKVHDEEFVDLSVELKDSSLQRTGTIAMPRCKLLSTSAKLAPDGQGGSVATVTAVFSVESFDPTSLVQPAK